MYMTQKFYLLSKSLLTKIALVAALMSWGGIAAEADDVVLFNGTLDSDWTNSGFTQSSGEIYTTWKPNSITTTTKHTLPEGKKLIINAKGTSKNSAKIEVKFSTDDTPSWNDVASIASFTSQLRKNTTDYYDLEIDISSTANYHLYFSGLYVNIKSIIIHDPSAPSLDEVILDETGANNTDFSSLTTTTTISAVKVFYTPVSGWNSICMPFNLKGYTAESTYLTTIFGSGWRAYQFSSYSDGIITFTERTAMLNMPANKPYLVYTENPQSVPVGGFEFEDVDVTYSSDPKTTNDATFQGTYAPIAAGSMPIGSYGLTPSGQIRPAGSKSSLKGYRAYFTGVSAPSGGSDVRLFILDGDETTDVGLFKMVEGEEHRVFNLNGQEVQKAKKGLYIVNGKKIVIK